MTVDTRTDYLSIAARYAAAPHDWPVAARFNPVERWYHRLATHDDYEVWLLTWLPGQGTELHDHGGSSGALYVARGELIEHVPDLSRTQSGQGELQERDGTGTDPGLTAHRLVEGAGRRFGSRHIHRVDNLSDRPAVSLHVYSPALTRMTRFRIGTGGLEPTAVERAGAQW